MGKRNRNTLTRSSLLTFFFSLPNGILRSFLVTSLSLKRGILLLGIIVTTCFSAYGAQQVQNQELPYDSLREEITDTIQEVLFPRTPHKDGTSPFYSTGMNSMDAALIQLYEDNAFEKLLPLLFSLSLTRLSPNYRKSIYTYWNRLETAPDFIAKASYMYELEEEAKRKKDPAAYICCYIWYTLRAVVDLIKKEAYYRKCFTLEKKQRGSLLSSPLTIEEIETHYFDEMFHPFESYSINLPTTAVFYTTLGMHVYQHYSTPPGRYAVLCSEPYWLYNGFLSLSLRAVSDKAHTQCMTRSRENDTLPETYIPDNELMEFITTYRLHALSSPELLLPEEWEQIKKKAAKEANRTVARHLPMLFYSKSSLLSPLPTDSYRTYCLKSILHYGIVLTAELHSLLCHPTYALEQILSIFKELLHDRFLTHCKSLILFKFCQAALYSRWSDKAFLHISRQLSSSWSCCIL